MKKLSIVLLAFLFIGLTNVTAQTTEKTITEEVKEEKKCCSKSEKSSCSKSKSKCSSEEKAACSKDKSKCSKGKEKKECCSKK